MTVFEPGNQHIANHVVEELRLYWSSMPIHAGIRPRDDRETLDHVQGNQTLQVSWRTIPSRPPSSACSDTYGAWANELVNDILDNDRGHVRGRFSQFPQQNEMKIVYVWEQRDLDSSGYRHHYLYVEIYT